MSLPTVGVFPGKYCGAIFQAETILFNIEAILIWAMRNGQANKTGNLGWKVGVRQGDGELEAVMV